MTRKVLSRAAVVSIAFGLLLSLSWTGTSWGQTNYPTRSINMTIGFAPGGVIDTAARFITGKAEKMLGQVFLITNNGADGGSAAYAAVAKAPADGYTIVAGSNSPLVGTPHLRSVPYKLDDFIPVMHYAVPMLTTVVVKVDAPWKTFKELVDYAKQNPGKVTYSTTGVGSPMHRAMEYVAKQEGIQWTHMPYPGAMPAFTALLVGKVNFQVGAGESVPSIKNGTVRILANLSEKRVKSWPDVPTLTEMGYNVYNEAVFMFAVPKGTPKAVVDKLDATFRKVMDDPGFPAVMDKVGFEASYRNSADTRKFNEDAYKRIGAMVEELKIPKNEETKK